MIIDDDILADVPQKHHEEARGVIERWRHPSRSEMQQLAKAADRIPPWQRRLLASIVRRVADDPGSGDRLRSRARQTLAKLVSSSD